MESERERPDGAGGPRSPARRRVAWATAATLLSLLVILWVLRGDKPARPLASTGRTGDPAPGPAVPNPTAPSTAGLGSPIPELTRPGDRLLATYGSPSGTVEQDLTWVGRLLENARVLIKGDNPLPLGSNAEIMAALMGRNGRREALLSSNHPSLGANGELLDRWGTPLFFHAQSASRIEIRSAGPDRLMWTADDVQRNHDGTFFRGVPKPGSTGP